MIHLNYKCLIGDTVRRQLISLAPHRRQQDLHALTHVIDRVLLEDGYRSIARYLERYA